MWGQMAQDAEKEMEEVKGEEGEMAGFKEEDVEMSRLDKMEKHSIIIALLREVRRELGLAQNSVAEMVDVLMSEKSDEEVEQTLNTKITAQGMIRKDLDRDGLMSGEWINVALSKLNTATDKTNLTGVNTLLRMLLYKVVPYDIAYSMPTHMAGGDGGEVEMWEEWVLEETGKATTSTQDAPKLSPKFGEYKVKSSVNSKGMREWKCPVGCGEVFGSSRKGAAHMNEHSAKFMSARIASTKRTIWIHTKNTNVSLDQKCTEKRENQWPQKGRVVGLCRERVQRRRKYLVQHQVHLKEQLVKRVAQEKI